VASGRDPALDYLRGVAIVFVVVNHLDADSLVRLVSAERIGVVTGAELFVVLSGVVLGIVHRRRVAQHGVGPSARRLWGRSAQLYVVSLAVVVAVFLVDALPEVRLSVLTTYTDPQGRVVPLYDRAGGAARLVADMLTLKAGPGQFNIMGLYVALLAFTPALLWLLHKRATWLMAALSAALYALVIGSPPRALPFQSEESFPLLVWQALFVTGLLLGWHWAAVVRMLDRRAALAALLAAVAAFAFYTWNNPWIELPVELRLHLIPEARFNTIYADWFDRRLLGIARLVNVVVVVLALHAVLTRLWAVTPPPLARLLPMLGRATLYVFVVHLPFVALADQVPARPGAAGVALATGATLAVLGGLWLLVRHRVAFRWIPR
jgi:hypothetical protein